MTETRPLLARFFSYYRPYKALFILDFGCAVAAGLLQLGFPLAVKYFVDELLPGQNWGLLLACAAALLAVYVANARLMAIVTYWGHALGVGIETDMRAEAFDHLQKLSFRFYDNAQTGQLITHVTKDLESAYSHSRRGDVGARYGDRVRDPAVACGAGDGPHLLDHRTPAGDDPACGPDRGRR